MGTRRSRSSTRNWPNVKECWKGVNIVWNTWRSSVELVWQTCETKITNSKRKLIPMNSNGWSFQARSSHSKWQGKPRNGPTFPSKLGNGRPTGEDDSGKTGWRSLQRDAFAYWRTV